MDWNWFFSAVAQSMAAIVGLIGAFVTTKILSKESLFKKRQNTALDFTQKSLSLRTVYSADEQNIAECPEIKYARNDREIVESASLVLYKIKLGETINNIDSQCFANKKMLNEIKSNPEYSATTNIIIIFLFILFLIGVIYPLHFMPLSSVNPELSIFAIKSNIVSIKGFLLLITSSIFFMFLIYIWLKHRGLRHEKYSRDLKVIANLEKFSKFEAFTNPIDED